MRAWYLLIGLLVSAPLCASDKPAFQPGDKVWLDRPEQGMAGLLGEGYAEGTVVQVKDNLVQVQLTSATRAWRHQQPPAMQPGAAPYLPISQVKGIPLIQVKRWEAGRQAYLERQRVYAALDPILFPREGMLNRDNIKAALSEPVRALAEKHGMADALAALEVLKTWDAYASTTAVGELTKAQAFVDFIGKLRSIVAQVPHGVESVHQTVTTAPVRVGANQRVWRKDSPDLGNSIAGVLAGQFALAIYERMDRAAFSASSSTEIEGIRRIDQAFWLFVTDNGRLPPPAQYKDLQAFLGMLWKEREQQFAPPERSSFRR